MFSRRKSHNKTQKSPAQRFLFVFGIIFFLMYLALGMMLILWRQLPLSLTRNQRLALGIVLIVYAFIRFVRLIKNQNKE